MLVSITVPVFNSEKTLKELYSRIKNVFESEYGMDFELILVDDSSKDDSFRIMTELHNCDKRVKAIQLTKNYGQHSALMCAFSYCRGEYVVTMDDDLQHVPEDIIELVKCIESHRNIDVVIGAYKEKKHGIVRNLGTKVSNLFTSKIFVKPIDLELTSFRIMRKNIVDSMLEMHVHYPRIGLMLLKITNRIINVEVSHDARKYGKSGYTFRRLVGDLVSNILNNSAFPLIILKNMGVISFFVSLLLACYYLCRFIVRGVSITGWTTLVILILLFSGSILLGIGILGEYLYRTLEETKKIPNYFVRQTYIED